jgi:hypothetical protein
MINWSVAYHFMGFAWFSKQSYGTHVADPVNKSLKRLLKNFTNGSEDF